MLRPWTDNSTVSPVVYHLLFGIGGGVTLITQNGNMNWNIGHMKRVEKCHSRVNMMANQLSPIEWPIVLWRVSFWSKLSWRCCRKGRRMLSTNWSVYIPAAAARPPIRGWCWACRPSHRRPKWIARVSMLVSSMVSLRAGIWSWWPIQKHTSNLTWKTPSNSMSSARGSDFQLFANIEILCVPSSAV